MIAVTVIIISSVLLVGLSQLYLKKRYQVNGKMQDILKEHWKYFGLTFVILCLILFLQSRYLLAQDIGFLPVTLRWAVLLWGIYLFAVTDSKEKKIPNQVVLFMLGVRIVFLIYEILANRDFWKLAVGQMVLGAVIGGGILLTAMIISRKGMGMGDVKMFLVIGAYVGSSRILPTMFYTFFISAIAGIILLIFKKAKIKDTIPMAPFAFTGVMMEYLLLTIGG